VAVRKQRGEQEGAKNNITLRTQPQWSASSTQVPQSFHNLPNSTTSWGLQNIRNMGHFIFETITISKSPAIVVHTWPLAFPRMHHFSLIHLSLISTKCPNNNVGLNLINSVRLFLYQQSADVKGRERSCHANHSNPSSLHQPRSNELQWGKDGYTNKFLNAVPWRRRQIVNNHNRNYFEHNFFEDSRTFQDFTRLQSNHDY
jgi:hypothetical protein